MTMQTAQDKHYSCGSRKDFKKAEMVLCITKINCLFNTTLLVLVRNIVTLMSFDKLQYITRVGITLIFHEDGRNIYTTILVIISLLKGFALHRNSPNIKIYFQNL